MVIKNAPPRYPRRGPSCLLVLFVLMGVGFGLFVITNASEVRDVIVPTPIPTPTRSAAEYALLADLSKRDNENREAIEFYRRSIQLDATRPEFFIQLIDLLIEENMAEEAIITAEQVTVLAPDNDDVWIAAAAAYIANGDRLIQAGDASGANLQYAQAVQAANRALDIEESSVGYAYAAGGLIFQGDPRNYERAQEFADTAVLIDNNNPEARYYMAKVFEYQGLYTNAIEQYQLGIERYQLDPELEPDSTLADLYIGLAFNYYGTSDISRAILSFEDAIASDPNNAVAHDGLAFMFLQLGEDAVAVEWAAKAVELDPGLARAHGRLGEAHFRQFNYPEAINALETATELYGETTDLNARFFNMLATAYIRSDLALCSQAVPIFEEVVNKTPTGALVETRALEGLAECRRESLQGS